VLNAWSELTWAMAVCLGLGGLGFSVLRRLLTRLKVLDAIALAFPLGAGLFTLSLFVVSWLGVRLSPLSAGLTWGSILALALLTPVRGTVGNSRLQREDYGSGRTREIPGKALAVVLLALIGASLVAAWLGVGRSYSGWDDIAVWGLRALVIAREGTVRAAGVSYPLNIPILIATFQFLGERLPASKLVFPLFYLSLSVGSLRFWLQRGVDTLPAILGACWLSSTPLLFEHATLGYANLPYACYLVLGSAETVQGILEGDVRRQMLGGLLLGLAAWTRPEGALTLLLIIAAVVPASLLILPRGLRAPGWMVLPTLLAGGWLILVGTQGAGGQMAQGLKAVADAVAQGELHLGAIYWIARYMARQALEISIWGLLVPACAFSAIVHRKRLSPKSYPDAFLVLVVLSVLAAGVTFQFYVADFTGELMNYLGNSANRMYMPAAVLAVLLAILLTREPAAIRMTIGPAADGSAGTET
jgi:hypothetical protein